MSKPRLRNISQSQPDTSRVPQRELPIGERPHADAEMTRVLKTAPLRMASDPSNGVITYWKRTTAPRAHDQASETPLLDCSTGVALSGLLVPIKKARAFARRTRK
jgi:hypothetical protein